MAVILDAGALVAVDRGDRGVLSRLKRARSAGVAVRTTGVVVAEAWRGPRQARLAKTLEALAVVAVDDGLGRGAGELLGRSGMSDACDATVVTIARNGDTILTSDPKDITALALAARRKVNVVRC